MQSVKAIQFCVFKRNPEARIMDYSFQHFRNSVQDCYCIVLRLFYSPYQWGRTSSSKGGATGGCCLMHACF